MLLILTSDKDLAADYLIVELIERGLPYFRLNAEALTTAQYSFSLSDGCANRWLKVGPRELDLKTVRAVWYRRAIQPTPPTDLDPGERVFVAGEFRHLATGLVLDTKARWVNPIDRVYVAEHKLFQLRIARRIGFRIPRTFVSNDLCALKEFARENPGNSICKPIFHGLFLDGHERYSVYTRRITPESLDNQESVSACPVMLQEEIPKAADLRATFIGRECFVADIENADPSQLDWRNPGAQLRYSTSRLSEEIEDKCRAMLNELGLVYGAFDFVRTPANELVFLEVNPTGEWAWLEEQLGFPMRRAFVRLFYEDPI